MEEQVVAMMQAIQAITPEVAAQAVAYERWVNGVWAIVGFIGVVVSWLLCRRFWDGLDWDDSWPAIVFGFVMAFALLVTVCATGDLVGSYIAPDYYAADAVLKMVRGGP